MEKYSRIPFSRAQYLSSIVKVDYYYYYVNKLNNAMGKIGSVQKGSLSHTQTHTHSSHQSVCFMFLSCPLSYLTIFEYGTNIQK